MDKYVSAKYIDEKLYPIRNLISIVESTDSNNIADKVANQKQDIAFAFAVIAKELGVTIPTDV